MAEYIERELAIETAIKNRGRGTPFDVVTLTVAMRKIPTADVVEVVRCRDCRYFTEGMAVGMCKRVKDKPIIPCCYNHFCSYGERKDT